MKPFISLCIVVKNEEKVLERCLDSVQGIVDEIIIVDTGSQDRTKDIALQYVDYVYDFQWINSFSAARNFAQSKATGKWILVLDADEYVDRENLIETIEDMKLAPENLDAYVVLIYNFLGAFGEKIVQHRHARIYRNNSNIYYVRDIHEQLEKKGGDLVYYKESKLNIFHTGYLAQTMKEKDKKERNAPLVAAELNKQSNQAFDLYNLGNELFSQKKYEEALTAYANSFQQKKTIEQKWVPFALIQIIICLIELKRYQQALTVIEDGRHLWPNSPEFRCLRAKIYIDLYRYEDAEVELKILTENKKDYQEFLKSIDFLEAFPHYMLGLINQKKQDLKHAVENYSKVIAFNHRDYDAIYNLLDILFDNEKEQDVIEFIYRKFGHREALAKYIVLKILLSLGEIGAIEEVIQKWSDLTIWRGIYIKLAILKEDYDAALTLTTTNSIKYLIQDSWVDLSDLLIVAIVKKNEDLLQVLIAEDPEIKIVSDLLNYGSNLFIETKYDMLVNFTKRCIEMRKDKLIELILGNAKQISHGLQLVLANLFYVNDKYREAFFLYDLLPSFKEYDAQAYVNIIEALMKQGNKSEARQLVLSAVDNDLVDFRIYKYAIQLFKEEKELKNEFIKLAQFHFSDSEFLKKISE